MGKSVSNDALWVKLSEIEEKINRYLEEQKIAASTQEQVDTSPELKAGRDEIVDVFKRCIQGLGTHCDSHFKTIYGNIGQLGENTNEIHKVLVSMSSEIRESEEQSKIKSEHDKSYLNFKMFKVKKNSIMIATLGLLVFILTLFSMKQQNDYSLLMNEHYRQYITIWKLQTQVDSLANAVKPTIEKKR